MDQGFLNEWLICGPFYSDRGWALLGEDYLFGEAGVAPKQGMFSFGKEWIRWDTEDNYLQFLFAPFEHTLFCAGYAHTYVYSPKQTDARLLCGSDDGIAVWINGEDVWFNDVNRACVPGDDQAPVKLREGWNSLLVKVRQGMAHWQFVAQLVDVNGDAIPGLKCAREAEYRASADGDGVSVGVRGRFFVETYTLGNGECSRLVQFEVGNLGEETLGDVTLSVDGDEVAVGRLEPGRTGIVDVNLSFERVVDVLGGKSVISASESGAEVKTAVKLSSSDRLLRDLFAPFFVPNGSAAELPAIMRGYPSREFARDENGRYVLVDPAGLRQYLGGVVGRYPMADADQQKTVDICDRLLARALAGDAGQFAALMGETHLPSVGGA